MLNIKDHYHNHAVNEFGCLFICSGLVYIIQSLLNTEPQLLVSFDWYLITDMSSLSVCIYQCDRFILRWNLDSLLNV